MKNKMAALSVISLVLALNLISVTGTEENLGLYYGDLNCRKLARTVYCSTIDGSVKICPVIENRPILVIRLAKERIPNSCIFGSSYGIATGVVWVAQKCQAVFNTISCVDQPDNKKIKESSPEIKVNLWSQEADNHIERAQASDEMKTKFAGAFQEYLPTLKDLWKKFGVDVEEGVLELSSREYLDAEFGTKSEELNVQSEDADLAETSTREVALTKNIGSDVVDKSATVEKHDSPEIHSKESRDMSMEILSGRRISVAHTTEMISSMDSDDEFDGAGIEEKGWTPSLTDHSCPEELSSESDELEEEVLPAGESVEETTEETKEMHSTEGDVSSTEVDETEESREITAEEENISLGISSSVSEDRTLKTSDEIVSPLPTDDERKDDKDAKSNLEETSKEILDTDSEETERQEEKSDEARQISLESEEILKILNAVKDKRNISRVINPDDELGGETLSAESHSSLVIDPIEDLIESTTSRELKGISITDSKESSDSSDVGKQNGRATNAETGTGQLAERETWNEIIDFKEGMDHWFYYVMKWYNEVAAVDKRQNQIPKYTSHKTTVLGQKLTTSRDKGLMAKHPLLFQQNEHEPFGLWGGGSSLDSQLYPNYHQRARRNRREATTAITTQTAASEVKEVTTVKPRLSLFDLLGAKKLVNPLIANLPLTPILKQVSKSLLPNVASITCKEKKAPTKQA